MSEQNMEKVPPSLDLAFDWVKDVLEQQAADSDSLTNKGALIFSVGSALIGFAIPLAFSQIPNVRLYPFGVLALIFYGFSVLALLLTLWLRGFISLKNPIKIREYFWDLELTEFKVQILTHMEDAFQDNQRKLNYKAYALQSIILVTGLEVLFLTLFIVFGV